MSLAPSQMGAAIRLAKSALSSGVLIRERIIPLAVHTAWAWLSVTGVPPLPACSGPPSAPISVGRLPPQSQYAVPFLFSRTPLGQGLHAEGLPHTPAPLHVAPLCEHAVSV